MAAINHFPAQCVSWCTEEMCPYTHTETWEYMGQTYFTRADAVAAKRFEEPEFDDG